MVENSKLVLSDPALRQMMNTLEVGGRCLLPMGQGGAKEFALARSQWEKAGLIQEDFDGKLHVSYRFGRIHYNLVNARSVSRFTVGEKTVMYIRGPVDLLCMSQNSQTADWVLYRCGMREFYYWLEKEVIVQNEGFLETQGFDDAQPEQTDLASLTSETRQAAIELHHDVFFRKNIKNTEEAEENA